MSASTDDPFDVFEGPASDPFDVLGVPAAPAELPTRPKRPRPSPVLPLVQRFVSQHARTTCADLEAAGDSSLALLLSEAAGHLSADPPATERCREVAERASASAWVALSEESGSSGGGSGGGGSGSGGGKGVR